MESPHPTPAAELPLAWEETDCPLCGCRDERLVLEAPGQDGKVCRLVRCADCGLGYLNPRPDAASIAQIYTPEYEWYHAPTPKARWLGPWVARLRHLANARSCGTPLPPAPFSDRLLAWLGDFWLRPDPNSLTAIPYQGEGRLLEFGCGSGWYAHRMQQLGWQVTGMDFNPHAALQAARQFGLPVLIGSLPHPAVEAESYDAITMGAVLEHVHRPRELIGAAVAALKPGGILAVSVPNLDSWGFRTFGAHWWGLQLPFHLLHFTPVTLRALLEDQGLEVVDLRMTARSGWMRRTLAAARHGANVPPRGRLLARLGRARLFNSLLTRWTVRDGRADCLLALARKPAGVAAAVRRTA